MSYRNLTLVEFMRYFEHSINTAGAGGPVVPLGLINEAHSRMKDMEMRLHDINRLTEEFE